VGVQSARDAMGYVAGGRQCSSEVIDRFLPLTLPLSIEHGGGVPDQKAGARPTRAGAKVVSRAELLSLRAGRLDQPPGLRIPTPQPCHHPWLYRQSPARRLRGVSACRESLPTTINRCRIDRARSPFVVLTWSYSWFDHLLSLPRTVFWQDGETMVSSRVCLFCARPWSSNATSA
jgi:hypothetical protein